MKQLKSKTCYIFIKEQLHQRTNAKASFGFNRSYHEINEALWTPLSPQYPVGQNMPYNTENAVISPEI